ncbi:UNVERIFIED_CONTAM: hypothetical protein Sradi_1525300 [Sesamum radiatum]|uniref:Exo_endo_phos domain-containing protein n=1 Tax=Sesamum radiatum TaxID=300843 RepID=A0AAW2UBS1_SESRA
MVVQLRSFSLNHIDVDVLSESRTANWRFTGFYGQPDASRHRLVWEKLRLLSNQSDAPWLCAADYNEVLFQHEKTGGDRPQWQMDT